MTIAALAALINSGSGPVAAYKTYTALLNQTGTAAPVATILENTTRWNVYLDKTKCRYLHNNGIVSLIYRANKTIVFGNARNSDQSALPSIGDGNRTSDTTIAFSYKPFYRQ